MAKLRRTALRGTGIVLVDDGREVCFTCRVDKEPIAIPETIDAIRALTAVERGGARTMAKMNKR